MTGQLWSVLVVLPDGEALALYVRAEGKSAAVQQGRRLHPDATEVYADIVP